MRVRLMFEVETSVANMVYARHAGRVLAESINDMRIRTVGRAEEAIVRRNLLKFTKFEVIKKDPKSGYSGAFIRMKTGSEGPTHDPYTFTEITIYRIVDGTHVDKVTFHNGLASYVKVGELITVKENPAKVFEKLVGFTPERAERIYHRIHGPFDRCPKCGSKKIKHSSGFVGEGLDYCTNCGHVFNEGDPTRYIE